MVLPLLLNMTIADGLRFLSYLWIYWEMKAYLSTLRDRSSPLICMKEIAGRNKRVNNTN